MINRILAVGNNIANISMESEDYDEVNSTSYFDIIKNVFLGIVLVSDKAGNGAYTFNSDKWINITLPSYSYSYAGHTKFCLLDQHTIHVSTFPFSWETSSFTLDTNDEWVSICYGSLGYIAISKLGITARSLDGNDWIMGSIPISSDNKLGIIYNSGTYYVMNDYYDSITPINNMYSSVDGITWNSYISAYTLDNFTGKLLNKDGCIYALFDGTYGGYPSTDISRSTDGISWEVMGSIGDDEGIKAKILDFIIDSSSGQYFMLVFHKFSATRKLKIVQWYPEAKEVIIAKVINTIPPHPNNVISNYIKISEGFPNNFWTSFNNTAESLI
jgi:hypothetical protein